MACEHAVQFYDHPGALVDALDEFITEPLRQGEAAVLIATPAHHALVHRRLTARGLDLRAAAAAGRYWPLDAAVMLRQFMRNGIPDDRQFRATIEPVLKRAGAGGRPVRGFGEMVALLWQDGLADATLELERLWQPLCREHSLPLLCAYPRAGFATNDTTFHEICHAHTRVV